MVLCVVVDVRGVVVASFGLFVDRMRRHVTNLSTEVSDSVLLLMFVALLLLLVLDSLWTP